MALVFLYSDPLGVEEPAVSTNLGTDTVRFGRVALSQSAEVGEASVSGLEIDDPDGTWNFAGLRAFTVQETSAPSNNQLVWHGVIEDRRVSRADSMRTGAARRWSMDMSDFNFVLAKRILTDSDAKRPDETAGDRLRWLLTSPHRIAFYDYGNVVYPSHQMEANDYRGQRPIDVIGDCAVEGGYTFWCEGNEAHGKAELFFLDPNGSSYNSSLRISNDYADYDGSVTFVPYEDAELTRSAERIAYGVYLAYTNGSVYVTNTTTGAQFTKIDQVAPMANVKHAARATRIANKFLSDNSTEDDRITCAIKVPAAQVNDIRAGHRFQAKFTHFPGYEDFTYMRVLRRTVVQEEEGGGHRGYANTEAYYRIELELSPIGVASAASCSNALSGVVTASASDQSNVGGGTHNIAITPVAGANSIIIAGHQGYANVNINNDIIAAGSMTSLFHFGGHATDGYRPSAVAMYRAVSGASGNYNTTSNYVGPGSSNGEFGFAGAVVSFRTSATSPVQHASIAQAGSHPTVTLASPPTAGNMLIMVIAEHDALSDVELQSHLDVSGWSILVGGEINNRGDNSVWVCARCVSAGDPSTYGVLQGTVVIDVSEWVIS